jgi:hypothetical protein
VTTLTTDVSHILRAINSNQLWKNSTAKLNKTTNRPHPTKPTKKNNLMTE